jgi:uncharacterized protein
MLNKIMKTSSTKPKILIVLTALLAVLMLASIGSTYLEGKDVLAQEASTFPSREKTISVTGTAISSVDPDQLVMQFGVETQEKTAKQALDTNSALMNKIIAAITSVGITKEELSTTGFNIYPVYEGYQDPTTNVWKQNLVGYKVTNTIKVETSKLSSAADILDSAVAAGANRVDSIYFTISPDRQMKIKDDLIGRAIENAQKKAGNALTPLNYKIIGVKMVSLSEFDMPPPRPMYSMDAVAMEKSLAPTPIFSSEQDISTTANVVFLIGSN